MTLGSVRPERLAAAARSLQPELWRRISAQADPLMQELASQGLVAWDREQTFGALQRRLANLRERRFAGLGGEPARVAERADQPLECIDAAWTLLRQGRYVHVELDPSRAPVLYSVIAGMVSLLGDGVLSVGAPGSLHVDWAEVGVLPAPRRAALVGADGDRELAAYVLARACLRRAGFDPRSVHHVFVIGPTERLERTLRRLWVGARMGGVDDPTAFAGAVSREQAEAFDAAERQWTGHAGVQVLCPGSRLDRAAANLKNRVFLAPALIRCGLSPLPEFECQGPMLVLHPVTPDVAESVLARFSPPGSRLRFGAAGRGSADHPEDRRFRGALLTERLPWGLPDPRP